MTTKVPAELSSTPSIVDNGNATAITINSSETVLIGKTADNTSDVGIVNGSTGYIYATRDGAVPLVLNRKTSDGTIQQFRKDNTTIGSFASQSGGIAAYLGSSYATLGAGDTGIFFSPDNDNIIPVTATSSSTRDNAIDLGSSSGRFKNLYLSGGAYLGGTGSQNQLDDYEEGTWTPAFQGATGIAYSEQTGYYIKIGDQVTLSFRMNVTTAPTSGSNIYIIMPYNPKGTGTGVAGTRWTLCTGTTLSDSVAALTGIANYASVANFYQYNSKNGSGYFNYTHFGTGLYSATLTYRID